MKLSQINIETRTALAYWIFGGLWILLSDRILILFLRDPVRLTSIQTLKGWVFVTASALLVYSLLKHYLSLQRQLDNALREQEERFRLLFNTSLDAILLAAPDGRILAANPAASLIFGWTQEDIQQMGRDGLLDARDSRVLAAIEERTRSGRFLGELAFVRKDGSALPCEVSSALFQDSKGRERISIVVRDITDRKAAEQRMLRLNRLYAALNQINQLIVHLRDRNSLFQQVCEIMVTHGKFQMAWVGLVNERDQTVQPAAFAGQEQGYLQNVQIKHLDETLGRGPAGEAIREGRCAISENIASDPSMAPWREQALKRGYRSLAAVPIRENQQVIGALMMYTAEAYDFNHEDESLLTEIGSDISSALDALIAETERKQAEETLRKTEGTLRESEDQLRKLNAELEQRVEQRTAELNAAMQKAQAADRLKSVFLATMSHELRTPLNSIIGFTGVLAQELAGPVNQEQAKQLNMVRQSAHHLLQLINDVLDLSKIEAGQLEIRKSHFNLNLLMEEILKITAPFAQKKGLDLQCVFTTATGLVWSDRQRVEQILLNLTYNAIKFTESGEIRILCGLKDGQISIEVKDTGIGIKPEDMDLLFRPFRQVDTGLNRRHEGTGLGLSITKNLVHLLGGEITVSSEWGKGSTFAVKLPAADHQQAN